MAFKIRLVLIFLSLLSIHGLFGQNLPVDFPYFNRFASLDSSNTQFEISKNVFERGKVKINVLSPAIRYLYESDFPFKQNTGEMLPAIGSQILLQTGVHVDFNWAEFQFRPSFLSSANRQYDAFPESHSELRWKNYSIWLNFSDAPSQVYNRNHRQLYLGQSYLKFNLFNHSISFSNESFFWGPGLHNSLLLSNQGEPFRHIAIKNDQPATFWLGKLDYELFGGWLRSSPDVAPDSTKQFVKSTLFFEKEVRSRYINGLRINFSPSILKNFEIEFQSLTQLYSDRAWDQLNYLPSLLYLLSSTESQISKRWSHYQSVSFKWSVPQEIQLYGAWGRKGERKSFLTSMQDPTLRTSFLYGFNKYTRVSKKLRLFAGIEGIFLARKNLQEVRNPNSWYIDFNIPQGHTHRGQWLGSGIGPGSNRVTVDVSLVTNNNNKLGILFDRRLNNSDYYYFQFEDVRDFRRYWVDHGIFLHGNLKLNRWIADIQLGQVFAINYQWELEEDPDIYFTNGRDLNSFQCFFNTAYLF